MKGHSMSQQPHWSQQVDYGAPSRMSLRRAFKVIIFSVGTLIVLLFLFAGSLPILVIRTSPANVQGRTIAIFVCLIVLVISIFLFIRSRHSMDSLRWRQYIWWLLGATLGGFLAFFLAQIFAFYFYTNDQP